MEDSSSLVSYDSEATIPGASCTEGQPGVYSNLGHDSSIIITTDINETGAPYPVTSSITGDPADSLGTYGVLLESSAETNVITPVSGSDGRGSSSYENAAILCEETSCVRNDRQSCCYEQRKLPGLEDGQSCCHEQRKLPDMESESDCCAARRGSIASKDGMLLLGPAVEEENADRITSELPVETTAETGYKVNQSDNCGPNLSTAVFPSPHAALANSKVCQDEKALNDTSSTIQHDRTDYKQFGGVVGSALTEPNNGDEVCDESVEDATDTNGEEILYKSPVPAELPQSGIQADDTPKRPARVAAKPSRFRDDQFQTEFRPGPRKNKVRQMHLNLGKGEPTAVQERPSPIPQKTPVRQGCQILREGESNGTTLGNSKQCCNSNQLLIQFHNDSRHHLFRKKGRRLGWPTWPKIRFVSRAESMEIPIQSVESTFHSIQTTPRQLQVESRHVPSQNVESTPCHTIQNATSIQVHGMQKATVVASVQENGIKRPAVRGNFPSQNVESMWFLASCVEYAPSPNISSPCRPQEHSSSNSASLPVCPRATNCQMQRRNVSKYL